MSDSVEDLIGKLAGELIVHADLPVECRRGTRVIAIVGAGCSRPAMIPDGRNLKDIIKTAILDQERLVRRDVLETELRPCGGIDKSSLEEFTQAACKYEHIQKKVIEILGRECLWPNQDDDVLPPAVLAYEMLAHLIKNGYIDHVISMNFDELLDYALRDELGPDTLRRVVGEQDTLLTHSQPDYVSWLVKPHGTISSPTSLRFTRANVEVFSLEIEHFIRNVLFHLDHDACSSSNSDSYRDDGIVLVVLGFAMRDPSLLNSIRGARIRAIYRIDPANLGSVAKHGVAPANGALAAPTPPGVSEMHIKMTADDALARLWIAVEAQSKRKGLRVVPVGRHQVVAAVCRSTVRHRTVLRDERLRLEILLAAAKSKGKFSLDQVARTPRIDSYLRPAHNRNVADRAELDQLVKQEILRHDWAGHTYYLDSIDRAKEALKRLAADRGLFEPDYLNTLYSHLDAVVDADEIEILRGRDSRNDWQFRDPHPIYNLTQMQQATQRVLWGTNRAQGVCKVFAICETGDWLKSDWLRRMVEGYPADITAELITIPRSEYAPLGKFRESDATPYAIPVPKAHPGDPPNITYLHWWEHSRHLTLAMTSASGELKPLRGIYFRRRLNTPLVHPVYLENTTDVNTLYAFFRHYRYRYYDQRVETKQLDRESHRDIAGLLKEGYDGRQQDRPHTERDDAAIKMNFDNTNHHYFAAFYPGNPQMIGAISYSQHGDQLDFSVVVVRSAWRSRGIARILVSKMEEEAYLYGGREIRLTTPERNRNFLEQVGYSKCVDPRPCGLGRIPMCKRIMR